VHKPFSKDSPRSVLQQMTADPAVLIPTPFFRLICITSRVPGAYSLRSLPQLKDVQSIGLLLKESAPPMPPRPVARGVSAIRIALKGWSSETISKFNQPIVARTTTQRVA